MVGPPAGADATVINATFHHFSPFGVSGVVVIQESHLAIHTWPESATPPSTSSPVGTQVDPWIAYNALKERFKAGSGSSIEMLRGQLGLMPTPESAPQYQTYDKHGTAPPSPRYTRNVWFTERDENRALSLRHTGDQLFREKSPYQLVEVYDTYAYGRMLTLDKMVMTSEKDEFVYHEMITQVPMFAHGAVKRALVIGGGDGGAVRELLRHEGLDEVVMVEIDEAVVRASREFLPSIGTSFDDARLELIIGDGIAYVSDAADAAFDLVIVDSTDPVGPGEGLFTADSTMLCGTMLAGTSLDTSLAWPPPSTVAQPASANAHAKEIQVAFILKLPAKPPFRHRGAGQTSFESTHTTPAQTAAPTRWR